jgi:hypothetical protein
MREPRAKVLFSWPRSNHQIGQVTDHFTWIAGSASSASSAYDVADAWHDSRDSSFVFGAVPFEYAVQPIWEDKLC